MRAATVTRVTKPKRAALKPQTKAFCRALASSIHDTVQQRLERLPAAYRSEIEAGVRAWCGGDSFKYTSKLRALVVEFARGGLEERLKSGELKAGALAGLSPAELRPDGLAAESAKKLAAEAAARQETTEWMMMKFA